MFGRRYRTRSVREERDAAAFMLLERREITAGALPRPARTARTVVPEPAGL
jgi:hypothetical protein